jgi:puromycin-sensitive aminopeptidase
MFDVLTYEKGASVLRMLEQYLGPEVFRAGVRDYLTRHAHGNAETVHLWEALGRASGQPVPEVMDGWIFAPGFPLVSVRRDGADLVLAQQRFTYLREPLAGTTPTGKPDQRWRVPVQVRVAGGGTTRVERVLLAETEARLRLPAGAEWALVNEGGHGFYRVRYAPDLLETLLARLDALAPIERFNLVSDTWAAATAGLVPLVDYLELTARFRGERDRNVWAALLGSFHVLSRLVEDADREPLAAFVRDRAGGALRDLGWTARTGESELTGQLRGNLVGALGALGDDRDVQARAADLHAAHAHGAAVDPNVLPAAIAVLAHAGDEARYADFLARFRSAATPQDEQRYLYALAGFRQPALVAQTLERCLSGEIRTQDAPFVVRAMLMAPHSRQAAWTFVKAQWAAMDRLYPKHGLRRLAEGVLGLARPAWERDVQAFFADKRADFGGKTLEQYLEQLHVAVVFREREGAALAKYLARFG